MGDWIRSLAHDGQLRWIGPEKGVIHLGKFSNNMSEMTNFGQKLELFFDHRHNSKFLKKTAS